LRERAKRKSFVAQDLPSGVTVFEDEPPRQSTYKSEHEAREERQNGVADYKLRMRVDMNNCLSQALAIWTFQIGFTLFILIDSYQSDEEGVTLNLTEIPNTNIAFARFIAGMIMHIHINMEILNGFRMMKYAINHWWKFKYHRSAVFAGFLQFFAMFMIALANYLVITISDTVLDVAKDFTALLIIADFDDIFANTNGSTQAKDIVTGDSYERCFTIEVTTSHDARGNKNSKISKDPVYELMVKDYATARKMEEEE